MIFQVCNDCKPFALHLKSDLNKWWNKCIETAEDNLNNRRGKKVKTNDDEDSYKRLIQTLLFISRVSRDKNIHTRRGAASKLLDNMKSLGDLENRVLWTSEQFKIIYGKSRRVFFNSRFGSGKTLLFQWKCINEANKDRNTMAYYIVMPAVVQQVSSAHSLQDVPKHLPTLIELEAEFFFRRYSRFNNARVKTWSDMAQEFPNQTSLFGVLFEFFRRHGSNASFFIDEYHEGYKKSNSATTTSCLPRLVIHNEIFFCSHQGYSIPAFLNRRDASQYRDL